MKIKEGYAYSKTHQWLAEQDGAFLVGITDYAQSELGGIVFVSLPEVGDTVKAGEPFGEAESAKVVAEIHSPVGGTVAAVNETVADEPDILNSDPYGAWLVRVTDVTEKTELMTAGAYKAYLETLRK